MRRGSRRALLCAVLAVAGALLLSGCSEAQVTPQVTASPTPFFLGSLPPIGFNHRFGNNPVAAADGFALERSLFAKQDYWEVGLRADPVAAGYVDETDQKAAQAARGKFTSLVMIIASESLPTLRRLVAAGDQGQQAYCVGLVDQLRAKGYTGLIDVSLIVFFGESDRHAQLTWSPLAGYKYSIYDNNLNGALTKPIPTATPFATPPPH